MSLHIEATNRKKEIVYSLKVHINPDGIELAKRFIEYIEEKEATK